MKKNAKKRARLFSVLGRYVSFFLLMAFVITVVIAFGVLCRSARQTKPP